MSSSQPPQPLSLADPVTALWGVGAERTALLEKLGIRTVEQLLLHRPHRYEDRREVRPIRDLRQGEAAIARGQIVALGTKWFAQRRKSIFEIVLDDGTGRLHCRWWNTPYMEKYFLRGDEVVVFGRVRSVKPRVIDHPESEVVDAGEDASIHLGRITPIYPLTEGLPQRWLRALIWRTLEGFDDRALELPEAIDLSQFREHPAVTRFPTRARAIRMLHFPGALAEAELSRQRLALDEFLALQARLRLRRRRFETRADAMPCAGDNRLIKPFLAQLGFKLTEAQTASLRELRRDLGGRHPMRRLLQGDVGSGKTVVAACCALMAIESGFSVALMAPTEVLAEQHFRTFSNWLRPLGVGVELRTGGLKTATPGPDPSRGRAVAAPEPNKACVHIGTHALIYEGFVPEKLGLVIIDEQHKFGVAQREELVRKGKFPHLLVMTATPIPRTLGLTLYGDLDISVIDALPPGRGRIQTFVRGAEKLPDVWAFMRGKLKEGRQAYVVYPRVEETEGGVKAVTREFETVAKAFAPYRVGLLHGRMDSREKERVMEAFRSNQLHVLLATSLIEVGLDVPNATIMVVENAELFGLAQLHQLRGRIGRGAHASHCVLVASARTKEARQRLQVLEQTTDGFRIAEADLNIRGPGELLGQEQSGLPKFRFGDLAQDLELIRLARDLAAGLSDAQLEKG